MIRLENEEVTCTHDCSTCKSNCASKKPSKEDLLAKPNPLSNVKKVIGVVSGKGGVGKSMITSMLAVIFNRRNFKTAILDADITGPSIPKIFGLQPGVSGCEEGIIPAQTKTGIEVMSVNLLLDDEKTPVVWRGPVIAGTVKQFWSEVVWSYVDYMFVDMPPGTGDVPLTVFQSLPLDGIVIMTSPQDLVSMIVSKAVNMAKAMDIPILGLVENMSYIECPDCKKPIHVFGESHIDEVAKEFNLDVLARLPIDPKLAALCDKGALELMENDYLETAADIIEKRLSAQA